LAPRWHGQQPSSALLRLWRTGSTVDTTDARTDETIAAIAATTAKIADKQQRRHHGNRRWRDHDL
jgi:hypothetical protein